MSGAEELLQTFRSLDPTRGEEEAWKVLRKYEIPADKIKSGITIGDEYEIFSFEIHLGEIHLTFSHFKDEDRKCNIECNVIEKTKNHKGEYYVLPFEESGLDCLVEFHRSRVKRVMSDIQPEKAEVLAWLSFIDENHMTLQWQ